MKDLDGDMVSVGRRLERDEVVEFVRDYAAGFGDPYTKRMIERLADALRGGAHSSYGEVSSSEEDAR